MKPDGFRDQLLIWKYLDELHLRGQVFHREEHLNVDDPMLVDHFGPTMMADELMDASYFRDDHFGLMLVDHFGLNYFVDATS